MSHPAQVQFVELVKEKYPYHFETLNVIDFGSLDINGNNRRFFQNCNYVGVDIGDGPNVDLICMAHAYVTDARIGCVISTEMLEHDCFWKDSLRNMYHILAPAGLMVITCAAPGRKAHGYKLSSPGDSPFTNKYYANVSIEDFDLVMPKSLFKLSFLRQTGTDLQFWGIKC